MVLAAYGIHDRDRKTTAGTRLHQTSERFVSNGCNGFGTRLVFLYCRNFRGTFWYIHFF